MQTMLSLLLLVLTYSAAGGSRRISFATSTRLGNHLNSQRTETSGVHGDISACSSLLRYCIEARVLSTGKLVHDHIIRRALERNPIIRNLLLHMYGNCLALHEARMLFSVQHPRDRFSWNSIIRAHAGHGFLKDAIQFFELMRKEEIVPDKVVLVSILSACTIEGSLSEGKIVHSHIAGGLFEKDVIVGTTLINMYGKWGSLTDARSVFDKLQDRDTISWNAMIAVYAQSEQCKLAALEIFVQMGQEGTMADNATFVNVFSSCSSEGALLEGKRLHAIANEIGLNADLLVSTAILNMYSKCGNPDDTRNMFDRFHGHDIVSWNTMIGAYAQDGQSKKALQLFGQMQREGVKPDKVSFLCILEAFSGEEALMDGKNMHACIARNGFESDLAIGTALVNMYGRCGSPEDARLIFDKMPKRSAFSWNTMIAAYAQNGQGHNAIQFFKKMQQEGLKPDKFTLLSIVNACANESEIEEIQTYITGTTLESDDATGSTLVYMYSKCGSLKNACRVFDKFPKESLELWNAMIAAFARNEEPTKALQLFEQMQLQGFLLDRISFISILDAYKNEAALTGGKRVHACIAGASLESDTAVGTALVNMYVRCGSLKDGGTLFKNMRERDVISWTALITAHCQHGKCNEAFELFENMHEEGFRPDKVTFISILSACTNPETVAEGKHIHRLIVESGSDSNVVVANALLNMYCRCGYVEDALRIFEKIRYCDAVTYASVISACANFAALPEGKQIHASIMGTETETDIIVGNALVNLYGKCGSLDDAQMMFDKMQHRDTVTWTVMVAAYAQQGKGKIALQLFNRMQHEGFRPNEITFVNVLSACSHDGLVDDACQYFLSMKSAYGIVPVVDHYDCLVDLFARAGRLEEAENLIKGMPFPTTVVSWTSLLSACKVLVDVERGECAAEQVFHLEPENPAPYVILSNIYGAAGRTEDSAEVFSKMQNRCIDLSLDHYALSVLSTTDALSQTRVYIEKKGCG